MSKQLELYHESSVKGKDPKTGREFLYDRSYVQVNGLKIMVKPKGQTAYGRFIELIDSKQKLVIMTEQFEYTNDQGAQTTDTLYILDGEEHLPVVASDSYGKRLMLKYLKSE